jgi:hypothetical protein
MSESKNMQAVLNEKQKKLVDAINTDAKSPKGVKNNDTKLKELKLKKSIQVTDDASTQVTDDESTDDDYSTDDDCSTDDDYIDLEHIINEQNAKITALEERLSKMETPQP